MSTYQKVITYQNTGILNNRNLNQIQIKEERITTIPIHIFQYLYESKTNTVTQIIRKTHF